MQRERGGRRLKLECLAKGGVPPTESLYRRISSYKKRCLREGLAGNRTTLTGRAVTEKISPERISPSGEGKN